MRGYGEGRDTPDVSAYSSSEPSWGLGCRVLSAASEAIALAIHLKDMMWRMRQYSKAPAQPATSYSNHHKC